MSIIAIVENDTIKLPMHVPDGTSVEVMLPEPQKQRTPSEMLEIFRKLQQAAAMTPEKAAEWKRRIADGRR
jgi:hypothetical protein